MSELTGLDLQAEGLLEATRPSNPWWKAWTVWRSAIGLTLLALAYRVALRDLYFGAEEEDYGNLGLILGTLQSGFTYIETQHMPLFTSLAALVTVGTGDAELGGEIVALLSGSLAVGVVTWIGWRWIHPATGLLAGLLFVFHPDAALHAATPLRISTFVLFSLVGIALIGERRPLRGAVFLSLAFLTRFETAFTLLPALLILAMIKREKRYFLATALLGTTVIGWAAYYRSAEGTLRFWGDVVTRTTEGAASMVHPSTLWGVLIGTVPDHIGHLIALAAPFGLWALLSLRGEGIEQRRWLALATAGVFGFFCLTVLLSSYAPDHNLFWKWSIASAPLLLLCGCHALVLLGTRVVESLRRQSALSLKTSLGLAFIVILTLSTVAIDYFSVTRSQLDRSAQWYGTQVHLMEWVETHYPADVGLVADNIPATWLSRIENERRVVRWSAPQPEESGEVGPGPTWVPINLSRSEFGAWLLEHKISLVIVFKENNRGSLDKAPWLAELIPQILGPASLQPIAREDGYGFIAWQVQGEGAGPHPDSLPPVEAGGIQVVLQEPAAPSD